MKAKEFLLKHDLQLGESEDGHEYMLSDDSDLVENFVNIMEEYAHHPHEIDEDRLAEVFANHADHTPYLNFDAFKEAVSELMNKTD